MSQAQPPNPVYRKADHKSTIIRLPELPLAGSLLWRGWLTKEGSFVKNLKERFATLHMGPSSTVVFDYREGPESTKILGQFTLGLTARCAPGDSCFPYPAHLVTHFFVGNGNDRIVLCFDNEQELVSFKDAVAFGMNAKNIVQAVLEKKAEAKKNEELARMQLEIEEMEKTAALEKQIAQMQQLTAENEVANSQFESDRQKLKDEVVQLKLSVSVEKEKLAEEEQNLRASVSQELLETKRSAEETAVRAKMLLESNRRASQSLSEMESSVQNRFVAFRKRENSSSVLRTVDETEYNRRIEQEKLEQLAREQEEIDRQAKILSAPRLKDLEMAVAGRAQAVQSSALELHREAAERADIENARSVQERRDAEMLIAQRPEFARLDGSNELVQHNSKETLSLAQILEQEGSLVSEYPQSGRKSPLSTSPATAPIKDRIKRLSVFATATSAAPLRTDEHVDSEGVVPIKDQVKRLNAVAAAVASFTSQPMSPGGTQLDSEVVVPVRERAKRSSIVAAAVASMSEPVALTHSPSSASEQPKARRPSVEAAFAVPVKERVRSMSSSVSPQVPQQKPGGPPSLSQLLEQEQGATGAPVESPHMHWIVRPSDA